MGRLADIQDVHEFAVDPKRAMDFAEDAPSRQSFEASRLAWPLLLASLRKAFQRELGPLSPNADLNAGIAASVLSCFSSELLESSGLFRSLWLMRITTAVEDAGADGRRAFGPGTVGFVLPGLHRTVRLKASSRAAQFSHNNRGFPRISHHDVPLLGTSSARAVDDTRHCLFQAVAHFGPSSPHAR